MQWQLWNIESGRIALLFFASRSLDSQLSSTHACVRQSKQQQILYHADPIPFLAVAILQRTFTAPQRLEAGGPDKSLEPWKTRERLGERVRERGTERERERERGRESDEVSQEEYARIPEIAGHPCLPSD